MRRMRTLAVLLMLAGILGGTAHGEDTQVHELNEGVGVELGECKSRCAGNSACGGVFVSVGSQKCKQMEEPELGSGIEHVIDQADTDSYHQHCMNKCQGRTMCKGIFIAKKGDKGAKCHMVLEQNPGNGHLTAKQGDASHVSDNSGKSVTVNIDVHHNSPDPKHK